MTETFFELLQVAVGRRDRLSRVVAAEEWHALLDMARKQAVAGVCMAGVERLPPCQWPPREVTLEWEATGRQIERRNRTVNKATAAVAAWFECRGFRTCILKGQGNAVVYPDPMARTPGDIDVWVSGGCRRVMAFARKCCLKERSCYHHIEWKPCGDVEVEVHYRPSFMFNPMHNRRLQKWFRMNFAVCHSHKIDLPDGAGRVAVPTFEFNVVYQLVHLFRHFFHEGIGLRQFADYYFLLTTNRELLATAWELRSKGLERLGADKDVMGDKHMVAAGLVLSEWKTTLSRFGLYDFSRAVMWVMERAFMLDRDCMISVPDESRGRLLMDEIMRGGNFGKYDTRVLTGVQPTPLRRNVARLYRDIRLCRFFPSECLCEPLFRLWHFGWRLLH